MINDRKIQRRTELLAKMMGQENLFVRFSERRTASFDLKNRVLHLPNYAKMDDSVRFSFNAHEIGHALWTPCVNITSILNILEDIRIEKLIKQKYRGSAMFMAESYAKLFADGWFGRTKADMIGDKFLNRLNIYAKCGDSVSFPKELFSAKEWKVVEMCKLMRTWDDVLEMERIIKEMLLDDIRDDDTNNDLQSGDGEGSGDESEQQSEPSSGDDSESEGDNDSSSSNSDEESDEESDDKGSSSSEDEAEDKDETEESSKGKAREPMTPEEEAMLEEMLKCDSQDDFDGNKANLQTEAVDVEMFVGDFKESDHIASQATFIEYTKRYITNPTEARLKRTKFVTKTKSVVNYLCKQFEMRKSASENLGLRTGKSGILDPELLSGYRFTDDVFMQYDIAPEGKNHGLVLVIDFSGSMSGNKIKVVMEEATVLALFARNIGIPLRIFGFTTGGLAPSDARRYEPNYLIRGNNTQIVELIDTTKKSNFNAAIEAMCNYDKWFRPISGCTPLETTAYVLSGIVRRWKIANEIEHVNTVFLTDGDSDTCSVSAVRDSWSVRRIVDTITNKTYEVKDTRVAHAYQLYKDRTKSKVTIFYVDDTYEDIRTHIVKYGRLTGYSADSYMQKMRKDHGVIKVDMFDQYVDSYIVMIPFDALNVKIDASGDSVREVKKSFLDSTSTRARGKVFARHFMMTMT